MKDMTDYKNLLAVGATNRNLGKTEFICRILKRFNDYEIIAIKIKTIYPGDSKFHGKGLDLETDYLIRKEDSIFGLDDSKRFISAGAKSVYYIKSKFEHLGKAILEVKSQYTDNQLFIAESNSLLEYFLPGGFIMITGPNPSIYKPSSAKYLKQADKIIRSDGCKFDIDPEALEIRVLKNKWDVKTQIYS